MPPPDQAQHVAEPLRCGKADTRMNATFPADEIGLEPIAADASYKSAGGDPRRLTCAHRGTSAALKLETQLDALAHRDVHALGCVRPPEGELVRNELHHPGIAGRPLTQLERGFAHAADPADPRRSAVANNVDRHRRTAQVHHVHVHVPLRGDFISTLRWRRSCRAAGRNHNRHTRPYGRPI